MPFSVVFIVLGPIPGAVAGAARRATGYIYIYTHTNVNPSIPARVKGNNGGVRQKATKPS